MHCVPAILLLTSALVAQESDQRPAELVLAPLASPAGAATRLPTLVEGADGRVHLTWAEDLEGGGAALHHATLAENGWSEAAEIVRAEDLLLNWADFPSLAVLEDGTLLAHWLRRGETPHGYDAEFALSSEGGWSSPLTLHTDRSPAEHGFVSVVPVNARSFGAVWLDGRAGGGDSHGHGETALIFRTISKDGELGPERVLDPNVCSCCQTSLVRRSDGDLMAAYRDRSDEEVRDISWVRQDGEDWSAPRSVHDDGWKIDGCPVNGPRLATSGELTAAAWFTGAGRGGGSVRLAFRQGDAAFGAPVDVDDGQPVGRVDVVFLDAESVVVTWMEYLGVEAGAEWRARLVRPSGDLGDSVTIAPISAERGSGYLRMVALDGEALVAWTATEPERRVECARLVLR